MQCYLAMMLALHLLRAFDMDSYLPEAPFICGNLANTHSTNVAVLNGKRNINANLLHLGFKKELNNNCNVSMKLLMYLSAINLVSCDISII